MINQRIFHAILSSVVIIMCITCSEGQPNAQELQTAGVTASFSLAFKDGPGLCCGFAATYYPTSTFTLGASSTSTLIPMIDFSLNPSVDTMPSQVFALRYVGLFRPTYPIQYTFQIGLADTFVNERYRLYVGTSLLLNFFTTAPAQIQSATLQFPVVDLSYTILLEYKHATAGNAGLKLMWKAHPKSSLSTMGQPPDKDVYQPYPPGLEVGFPRNGRILCEYVMANGKNKQRFKMIAKGSSQMHKNSNMGTYHQFIGYAWVSVAGQYSLQTSILHKNGLQIAMKDDDPDRPYLPPFILTEPSLITWPHAITEMYTQNIDMLALYDNVALRMFGYLVAPVTSVYTFYVGIGSVSGTQRMSFWLDERWLLNNSVVPMPATTLSCTIALSSDQIYDIEVLYFSLSSSTTMTIDWIYGSGPRSRVPSEYFYASQIPQKELNITVVQNSTACATTSRAYGSGLSIMTAARIAKFSISLKDQFGNPAEVSSKSGLTELRFASTFNSNFVPGTLFSVAHASTSGRGSGATFTLSVDASKFLTAKVIVQGNNYAIGDTVTINTANTAIGGAGAPAVVFFVEETGSDEPYAILPMPVSVRWMSSDGGCSTPNQCRFSKGTVTIAGKSEYEVTIRAPQTASTTFYDRYRVIPSLFSVDLLTCCGFSATYYPSAVTTAPSLAMGVSTIEYSQAGQFWAANPLLNSFRSRYIGMLYVSVSEVFTFFVSVTTANDRYTLTVDNLVIINKMASAPVVPSQSQTILLTTNSFYEVRLDYLHADTSATKLLKLEMLSASTGSKHTVGARSFEVYKPYPLGHAIGFSSGIAATYYSDTAATSPSISTTQSSIDWSSETYKKQPFADASDDGIFAARFSGIFKPTVHGIYTFSLNLGTPQETARIAINRALGTTILDPFSSSLQVLTSTYYASATQDPVTFMVDYRSHTSFQNGAKFVLSYASSNSWMQSLQYDGVFAMSNAIGKIDQKNTQAPMYVSPLGNAVSVSDSNFDWQKTYCSSQLVNVDPIFLDKVAKYCPQPPRSAMDLDLGGQIIFESLSPSLSLVFGKGLTICTAAVSCSFSITVLDRFQNSRTYGDDYLELSLMKASSVLSSFAIRPLITFPRKSLADYISKFEVVFVPENKGRLYMVVGAITNVSSYNSVLVSASNSSYNDTKGLIYVQIANLLSIPVMPAMPQPFSNYSYYSYPTVFTAGIPTSISLVAFDVFRNPATSVQSTTSIFVSQPHFVMILGKPVYSDSLSSQTLSSALGADRLAWDQTRSFSGSSTIQSSTFNTGSNSYSFSITQATKSGIYRVSCGIALTSGAVGPVGIGLSATYYNDEQGEYAHSSFLSNMPHQNSDFLWNFKIHQGPDPSNSLDKDGYFSIRYAGYLVLGGSGVTGYTFTATVGHTNQYARLLLDDVPILDKWSETWSAGLTKTTGLIGAAASVLYPFELSAKYYHKLEIFWSSRKLSAQDDETNFKLQIQLNGANILKSDMFPMIELDCPDVQVVPAAFCASTSTRYLKSSTSTMTAGSPFQMAVDAKDAFYNPMLLANRKLTSGLIVCFVHTFLRPDNARTAGTYKHISGISTTGTGSGAQFLVKIEEVTKNVQVNLTAMGKGYALGDTVTIPSATWFGGSDIIWKVLCVQFNGGLCGRIDSATATLAATTVNVGSTKGSIVSILPYIPQTDPYWTANTYTVVPTCIDYRYLDSDSLVSCSGTGAQLIIVIESKAYTCNTPNAAGSVACSGKLSWISSVTLAAVGSGYNVNDILVVPASSLGVNIVTSPSSRNVNITVQTVVRGNGATFSITIDGNSNIFVSLLNAGTNYSKYENVLLMNAAFGALNMTVMELVGDISEAISPIYASAASLGCSVLNPKTGLTKIEFAVKKSSLFTALGSLASVTHASTSGLGSGATFTLTVDSSKYLKAVITAHGQNYAIGDTVTINTASTAIGGAGAPAVVFYVAEIGGAFLTATRITDPAGDWVVGSYSGVTGATSGLGSGAVFNFVYQTSSSLSPTLSFTATSVGSGYRTGDTITITSNPATVTNPLVLLVDGISSIPSCPPVLKTVTLDAGSCARCPTVSANYASFSDSETVFVNLNPTVAGTYQIEVAVGVGQGLLATYYTDNMPDVSSYSPNSNTVVVVPGIDFSVSSGNPFPTSGTSARFRGFIFPSQAEMYTFYLNHKNVNDRAKLWIDGTLLFDSWDANPTSLEFSAKFVFHSANVPFDLHLVYRQVGASIQSKGLTLRWQHIV